MGVMAGLQCLVRALIFALMASSAKGDLWANLGLSGDSEGDAVVELTDSNFKEKVLASNVPAFVQFHAPWCHYCKQMMPTWIKLAEELKGKTLIGRVDCVENVILRRKFNVQGFPTLLLFRKDEISEYNGPRTADALKLWLKKMKAIYEPGPRITVLHTFAHRGEAEPIRLLLAATVWRT